jgi:hypothetical protein
MDISAPVYDHKASFDSRPGIISFHRLIQISIHVPEKSSICIIGEPIDSTGYRCGKYSSNLLIMI